MVPNWLSNTGTTHGTLIGEAASLQEFHWFLPPPPLGSERETFASIPKKAPHILTDDVVTTGPHRIEEQEQSENLRIQQMESIPPRSCFTSGELSR